MTIQSKLEALSPEKRQNVYSRLWLELTIGARAIWSDPSYDDTEKLNALKWLNEIQHRTWHAFMEPGQSPSAFIDLIQDHIRQAEIIRGHVGACCRNAYDATVRT